MCDLLVGKPDLPVGYPRLKSSTIQRKSSWDTRYEGAKTPDTTTPPAAEPSTNGMCVRPSDSSSETSPDVEHSSNTQSHTPTKNSPTSSASSSNNSVATIMDVVSDFCFVIYTVKIN
ncbi:hypothetical protein JTE90_008157 [Oedothorax gibbosus]|uniref:Uncharacterized protein n=1 Tax=Oedothorax gibbosus TaxID=931172 RepID=A0AAV6VG42_9ARAC|nr:hypothetical protein JTE90_008157 [Oedothorax gibbosus]